MYEIKGRNFRLTYTVIPKLKFVKIYEFQPVAYQINWQDKLTTAINSVEEEDYIPQTGDPNVIFNTLKMIYEGHNTPYKLGLAVGSTAKKEKDIARRGQYVGKWVVQLGLAKSSKQNNASTIYELSSPILSAFCRNDKDTIWRLMAESLLGFSPIQLAIYQTTKGQEQLTLEVIEKIFKDLKISSIGGTTSRRRAQSIRALTIWVARMSGIPIRRKGQLYVQPYIPFIYADSQL